MFQPFANCCCIPKPQITINFLFLFKLHSLHIWQHICCIGPFKQYVTLYLGAVQKIRYVTTGGKQFVTPTFLLIKTHLLMLLEKKSCFTTRLALKVFSYLFISHYQPCKSNHSTFKIKISQGDQKSAIKLSRINYPDVTFYLKSITVI